MLFCFCFFLISCWKWWPWKHISICLYVLAVSCAFPASYPVFWRSLCRRSIADEVDWLKSRLPVGHNYSLSWLQILLAHHGTIGQRQLVRRAARSLHGLEKTWERRGENTEIPLARFSRSKMHWTAKRRHLPWNIWQIMSSLLLFIWFVSIRPSSVVRHFKWQWNKC